MLFFKHSPSCGVSVAVLRAFEAAWVREALPGLTPYLVSVRSQRMLSNYLAKKYAVKHESPQLLLIQHGRCAFHASHEHIRHKDVKNYLGN